MASKFYGLDRGVTANPDNVTVADSTTGLDIEVTVDLAANLNTLDVAERLDAIKRRILDGRDSVLGQV